MIILNPAISVCPPAAALAALALLLVDLLLLSPLSSSVVEIGEALCPPKISVSIAAISDASELYIFTNIMSFSLSILFNIFISLSRFDSVSTIISVFSGA